jgi:hypothetical protein
MLFSNNLGLTEYQNGDIIAFDIFNSQVNGFTLTNFFMECRLFFGDYSTGMPVKIVCG